MPPLKATATRLRPRRISSRRSRRASRSGGSAVAVSGMGSLARAGGYIIIIRHRGETGNKEARTADERGAGTEPLFLRGGEGFGIVFAPIPPEACGSCARGQRWTRPVQEGPNYTMSQPRRLPLGAEVLPEGGAHFRVWGPPRRR